MSQKDIFKLGDLYSSTVKDNLQEIEGIIKQLQIMDSIGIEEFSNILNLTSSNLVDKWKKGRKSLRTEIAFNIIPNYPTSVLKTSLTIDAMINLLDDILDELMEKEERGLYIIELIRVLAIFNQQNISTEFQNKISKYFNKILCIAIPEIIYKEKIKRAKDFDQRLYYSIQCYDCKSMVMDIFLELPLIELYGDIETVDDIVSLGRIHRAIYLIKKDFRDLEHDTEQNTETPIVILAEEDKEKLQRYMDKMIEHYKNEAEMVRSKKYSKEFVDIVKRMQSLISNEIEDYKGDKHK